MSALIQASVPAVPVGTIVAYAADGDPDEHWLVCDGRAISRETYALLFDKIGTTYGAGNGTTTFNIPNLIGRVVQGKGTHSEVDALGKNDGLAAAARRWLRSLSGSFSGGGSTDGVGDHGHGAGGPTGGDPGSLTQVQSGTGAIVASLNHTHSIGGAGGHSHGVSVSGGISGNTSGGGFLVLNHLIYVG